MVYEDETKDVWVPPSLKQDEILRLKGDLDGAIASATSQLATRRSPSSSIRTLTMACLESGRELEGIAALRNTCDGNDDAVVRAMLLLRSRSADQSERSALCMLANDYTMRLIMEGADSSKIIRSIVATSQAGLALERTTLDAIRLAVAKETALQLLLLFAHAKPCQGRAFSTPECLCFKLFGNSYIV